MATNLIVIAPESGSKLRVCGQGFDDAGVAYVFKVKPKPRWAQIGVFSQFELLGLDVFHSGAVDLIATPIVDDLEMPALEFPLQIPAPGNWKRTTVEGRIPAVAGQVAFGQKLTFRIRTNTFTALFHLMGAYFDARPEENYRAK